MKLDIAARRADFHALHSEGYFLLPTASTVEGARQLEKMGFAGVATSNATFAQASVRFGGRVSRDEVLAKLRRVVDATEVAVNADFGDGYAATLCELKVNVRQAIDTGIAAISIGDSRDGKLYSLHEAEARMEACHEAIICSGADVLLEARADGFLAGQESVDETIARLTTYAWVGADVLCAPGFSDSKAIKALVKAVSPKPVDVQLMRSGITAAQLGDLGVRRISVGDAFSRASSKDFGCAAQHFMDFGDLPQYPRVAA